MSMVELSVGVANSVWNCPLVRLGPSNRDFCMELSVGMAIYVWNCPLARLGPSNRDFCMELSVGKCGPFES